MEQSRAAAPRGSGEAGRGAGAPRPGISPPADGTRPGEAVREDHGRGSYGAGARGAPWPDPSPQARREPREHGSGEHAAGERGSGEPGRGAGTRGRPTADGPAPGAHAYGTGEQPDGTARAPGRPAPRKLPARHSVRGQILDALRTALVGGDLLPGEVYSAPALGARFGVSPTPVREAMQQLAAEGAVEVVPNRGFRVARRSERDLAELAEVRALLEVPVLLRLARTRPPASWEELRPLAAAGVAAAARGDRVGYAEADRAFHHAVLALSGNRQLALIGDELHRRGQTPAGRTRATGTAGLLAEAAEHNALLDALSTGDTAAVEQLAREHFTAARPPRV
ncbi:FCD domain-containing protein [Streptomyces sp. S07_1.15]|nr:GntR family transcriptional regulator [Streptomyces sp. S07_1.15]MCC3651049.1 FCD domain-containing protein [Streptomyces sp. S07_1.15]